MNSSPYAGTTPVLCWYRVFRRDRHAGRITFEDGTIMVHAQRSEHLPHEVEYAVRALPLPRWAQKVTHVQLTHYLPRCGHANF